MKKYIPALLWALLILFLSGFPGNKIPVVSFKFTDKIAHFIMYAVLSVLLLFGKTNNKSLSFNVNVLVILICVCYGGFMEFLQNTIFINRSGNWYDFLANTIGVFLGVLFFPFIRKILPKKR